MAIITSGKTFANGEQLSADKLNQVITEATFNASDAVDGSTMTLIGGAMAVADGGIATAKIADSGIATAKIADSAVTKAKIENVANMKALGNTSGSAASPQEVAILDENDMSSDSDTSLATQQSIKAFAGMTPVQNGSGGGYSGGESLTFPNGLTMKFGRVAATSDSDYTVNFAENFNTAVISAMAITNVSASETLNAQIVGTPGVGSMVVGIRNENHLTGFYWQAIGY